MSVEYLEHENEDAELYYAVRPNKSQIKRDIALIFALAEEIVALSANQLAGLKLPEHIRAAVVQATKMPADAARRRQLKYITAELRKIELAPVQEKLDRIKNQSIHAVREHHQAESWRDKLIADDSNQILTEFLATYPNADSQQIRQLQRNAKKELAAQKPPKSSRLLYKCIKSLFESA